MQGSPAATGRILRLALVLSLLLLPLAGIGVFAVAGPASAAVPRLAQESQTPTPESTVTPTSTATPTPPATATPAPSFDDLEPDVVTSEEDSEGMGRGPGRHVVVVNNRRDETMRVRGSVQLKRIGGDVVEPVNVAGAFSSCTDCQSFAVALQIVLRNEDASVVAPQNAAVAINEECTRCTTVARALQYVVPVKDPKETPDDVRALVREMDRELREIAQTARAGRMSIEEADARINAVVSSFRELGLSLYEDRRSDED